MSILNSATKRALADETNTSDDSRPTMTKKSVTFALSPQLAPEPSALSMSSVTAANSVAPQWPVGFEDLWASADPHGLLGKVSGVQNSSKKYVTVQLGEKVSMKLESRTLFKKDHLAVYAPSDPVLTAYLPTASTVLSPLVIVANRLQGRGFKKPFTLSIKHTALDWFYFNLVLKFRPINRSDLQLLPADNADWQNLEQQPMVIAGQMTISSDKAGVFVVTAQLKHEVIEAGPPGILYSSKLSKFISVRVPKFALDRGTLLLCQTWPLTPAKFFECRSWAADLCLDILRMSNIYEVQPMTPNVGCKRACTLKFPLPGAEKDEEISFQPRNLAIFVQNRPDADWHILDVPIALTKTTFSFDTKQFGRFCLVEHTGERMHRLKDSVTFMATHYGHFVGDLLLFGKFGFQNWTFQMIPVLKSAADNVRMEMSRAGWVDLDEWRYEDPDTMTAPVEVTRKPSLLKDRFLVKRPLGTEPKKPLFELPGIELTDNAKVELQLYGDLVVVRRALTGRNRVPDGERTPESEMSRTELPMETDFDDEAQLVSSDSSVATRFLLHQDNRRVFDVRPLKRDDALTLSAKVFVSAKGDHDVLAKMWSIGVAEQVVSEFFALPVEHLQKAADSVAREPRVVSHSAPPEIASKPSRRRNVFVLPSMASHNEPKKPPSAEERLKIITRLTTPTKIRQQVYKESRALSRKSLANISRMIPDGLILGVSLGISDSRITGIGFDALANCLSLSEVTYKILLAWKRDIVKMPQNAQIEALCSALQSIGRNDVSAHVKLCFEHNDDVSFLSV